jgi:hypothetical protein
MVRVIGHARIHGCELWHEGLRGLYSARRLETASNRHHKHGVVSERRVVALCKKDFAISSRKF